MNEMVFFLWEQRESNPRPSACKADALNQLPFRLFCPITALDFSPQSVTTERLLPLSSFVRLVLEQNKLRSFPRCLFCSSDKISVLRCGRDSNPRPPA